MIYFCNDLYLCVGPNYEVKLKENIFKPVFSNYKPFLHFKIFDKNISTSVLDKNVGCDQMQQIT